MVVGVKTDEIIVMDGGVVLIRDAGGMSSHNDSVETLIIIIMTLLV